MCECVSESLDNNVTTSFFRNEAVEFSITAVDEESGVKSVEYYFSSTVLSDEQLKSITAWTKGTSGTVTNDGEYIIYVRAQDNVGNTTYINSTGFVVDTVLPTLSGAENGKVYCSELTLTVNEDCVLVMDCEVIQKNEHGQYVISAIGTHNISVTDRAGNALSLTVTLNDGHTPSEWITETEATCTETGHNVRKCTYCDTVLETEAVEPLGHRLQFGKCVVCGYFYAYAWVVAGVAVVVVGVLIYVVLKVIRRR